MTENLQSHTQADGSTCKKDVLEVIFSCIICHKTPSEILEYPSVESSAGVGDQVISEHQRRKLPAVWLSSCAHTVCPRHFTDPQLLALPSHREACPYCIAHRKDPSDKTFYPIEGFQVGQYDSRISLEFFQVPPVDLENQNAAVGFQYSALLRYSLAARQRIQTLTTTVSEYKNKEPEIIRRIQEVPILKRENQELKGLVARLRGESLDETRMDNKRKSSRYQERETKKRQSTDIGDANNHDNSKYTRREVRSSEVEPRAEKQPDNGIGPAVAGSPSFQVPSFSISKDYSSSSHQQSTVSQDHGLNKKTIPSRLTTQSTYRNSRPLETKDLPMRERLEIGVPSITPDFDLTNGNGSHLHDLSYLYIPPSPSTKDTYLPQSRYPTYRTGGKEIGNDLFNQYRYSSTPPRPTQPLSGSSIPLNSAYNGNHTFNGRLTRQPSISSSVQSHHPLSSMVSSSGIEQLPPPRIPPELSQAVRRNAISYYTNNRRGEMDRHKGGDRGSSRTTPFRYQENHFGNTFPTLSRVSTPSSSSRGNHRDMNPIESLQFLEQRQRQQRHERLSMSGSYRVVDSNTVGCDPSRNEIVGGDSGSGSIIDRQSGEEEEEEEDGFMNSDLGDNSGEYGQQRQSSRSNLEHNSGLNGRGGTFSYAPRYIRK